MSWRFLVTNTFHDFVTHSPPPQIQFNVDRASDFVSTDTHTSVQITVKTNWKIRRDHRSRRVTRHPVCSAASLRCTVARVRCFSDGIDRTWKKKNRTVSVDTNNEPNTAHARGIFAASRFRRFSPRTRKKKKSRRNRRLTRRPRLFFSIFDVGYCVLLRTIRSAKTELHARKKVQRPNAL